MKTPGGILIETLRVYLEQGGSQRQTADALGIHRNTLGYRLRQIRQLLTVDLDAPNTRLTLHLALIMLVGAVFGPLMGFQMGALTLLLSGFITGGIGPWLPFQMLACGWIGMTAGWLPALRSERSRVVMLAIFGAVWGLLFGALMNIWFWPFTAPGAGADSSLYWSPDLSMAETVARYARFYVVTSLPFDAFRAIGNIVLVLILGRPILRLLERYRARFSWEPWEPLDEERQAEPGVG